MSANPNALRSSTDRWRQSEAVARFLAEPAAYDPRPSRVELIETHISWVFLTDNRAYKLKKPVSYEFVDFSTLKARREACEAEVRLNRRLARDVYLGVLPISDHGDSFRLGDDSQPIDYVVHMRRLPADRCLDALLEGRRERLPSLTGLVEKLTAFYRQLPPLRIGGHQYRHDIEHHVRANRADLLHSADDAQRVLTKRLHAAQLSLLLTRPELFDRRVATGRIVEGHGDLRTEHVYLLPEPVIIDCLEFSAELRRLDVLDELCFFAMECAAAGHHDVGRQVLDSCLESLGDEPPGELVAFYQSYRATVRAKVNRLRALQLALDARERARCAADRYLEIADERARQLGPPLLIVVRGLSGCGKSTLASGLAELLGAELLGADGIRREVFQAAAFERVESYGGGIYSAERRDRVYREMFDRADALLAERVPVVLDASFLAAAAREQAAAVARRHGGRFVMFRCECPAGFARDRIASRRRRGVGLSQARPEFVRLQHENEEADPAGLTSQSIDTTGSPADSLRQAITALRQRGE